MKLLRWRRSIRYVAASAWPVAVAIACGTTDENATLPVPPLDGGADGVEPVVPNEAGAESASPPAACTIRRAVIKPSAIFCANSRLHVDDAYVPWEGPPNPESPSVEDENGRAVCLSSSAVRNATRSVQNVEIRGWVTRDFGMLCRELTVKDEVTFDLALDLDWAPEDSSPGEPPITRLRTLADVLQQVPATNIIKFGPRQLADGSGWGGGGPGRVIIHVEICGWGQGRSKTSYAKYGPPPGWEGECGNDGIGPAYFSHEILPDGERSFNTGDYLRVIGTLWHDDTHLDTVDATDPLSCWADHVADGDYWTEIHTADRVERIPPPPLRTAYDLIGYASCSTSPIAVTDDVVLPGPATAPDSKIASVTPLLRNPSGGTYTPPVIDGRSLHFSISATGPMLAFYQVRWDTCAPDCSGRCGGPDGCGGTCPTEACPPDRVCDEGGACSCPAGSTPCPTECHPLP
jgi:hypothetical protein